MSEKGELAIFIAYPNLCCTKRLWSDTKTKYIALLIAIEIPTGLYLLRMIPRQSLKQTFPRMKYRKFIFSSGIRIINGYAFLLNVSYCTLLCVMYEKFSRS